MQKRHTERITRLSVIAHRSAHSSKHLLWIARSGLLLGLAGSAFAGLASAQSANLIQHSQELDQWKRVQGITVTADAAEAPDGTMTAEQLIDVANGAQPRVQATPIIAASDSYVFSCFVRADSLTRATLRIRAGSTIVGTKTVDISPTWQRVSVPTRSLISAGSSLCAEVYPGTERGESGAIFAWGAELEAGGGGSTEPSSLQVPTGLTASWNGSVVQVRWSANTEPNLAEYQVERGPNPQSCSQVADPVEPAYDDAGVVAGNTYYYRVRAVDTDGNATGPSEVVSVVIPPAPVTVSPPTGVSAVWAGTNVQVRWAPNPEPDVMEYLVERSTDSGVSFSEIAAATQPAYPDIDTIAGTTYAYRVRAVAGGSVSDPSAVVSVTVPSGPPVMPPVTPPDNPPVSPSPFTPPGNPPATPPVVSGTSRGYLTTPQELQQIRSKAAAGIEPYKSAVNSLLSYAGAPANWPHGVVDPINRDLLHQAAALVYAKGLAYHLTGNSEYAASAREQILALTTQGTGGSEYSGGNGDILTLGRHIPGYIFGADLIEGFSGWTAQDKLTFQQWLATQVYHKIDWASDERSTNWGSVCSAATAVLADYLAGSGLRLRDRNGAELTPRQAYEEANQRQKDRINGNSYMFNSVCAENWAVGIRPDGGIPDELGRGSAGCDGPYLLSQDSSWSYMHAHLSGTLLHAELLLRRGDASLFNNMKPNGGGSILRAIHFVIQNPNDPSKSFDWLDSRKTILEIAYRYYRDPAIAAQLWIGTSKRHVAGSWNSANPHFGTLTHGFAVNENPGLPPVTAPPAE